MRKIWLTSIAVLTCTTFLVSPSFAEEKSKPVNPFVEFLKQQKELRKNALEAKTNKVAPKKVIKKKAPAKSASKKSAKKASAEAKNKAKEKTAKAKNPFEEFWKKKAEERKLAAAARKEKQKELAQARAEKAAKLKADKLAAKKAAAEAKAEKLAAKKAADEARAQKLAAQKEANQAAKNKEIASVDEAKTNETKADVAKPKPSFTLFPFLKKKPVQTANVDNAAATTEAATKKLELENKIKEAKALEASKLNDDAAIAEPKKPKKGFFAFLARPADSQGRGGLPFSIGGVRTLAKKPSVQWGNATINTAMLNPYYQGISYGTVWTTTRGLNRNGKDLLKVLKNADNEGLSSQKYLKGMDGKLSRARGQDLSYAELFLSEAFANYARDVHLGVTRSKITASDIVIEPKSFDMKTWLAEARRRGPNSALASLRPRHPQYNALMKTMARTSDPAARQKIAANLERWRWLPSNLGANYVLVNQPAFEMFTYRGGREIDHRRVIVGDPENQSPIFSDRVQTVEFNPEWNVPPSIAGKEFLPKLIKNPNYLQSNNYRLHESWGGAADPLNPKKINWSKIDPENFPYRIVQNNGDKNALGQVKFLFPNKFHVYLHDTPYRSLFDKENRALSHGCIRVDKPLDFASILFSLDNSVNVNIDEELAKEERSAVALNEEGIPIHLSYFTVWASPSGKAEFFNDVYGRDAMVINKM